MKQDPIASRRLALGGLTGLAFAGSIPTVWANTSEEVSFPAAQSPIDEFYIRVLKLALSRDSTRFRLKQWDGRVQKNRALLELARGSMFNVCWGVTTLDREKMLLPVPLSLDRGLSGWRICLVRAADRERLKDVRTVADLALLRIGQGYDWADTAVLRANGLNVITGQDWQGLSRMLEQGRFDCLPRSLSQIWAELDLIGSNAVVDQHLLIRYPSSVYFFVRKNNERLAQALIDGLNRAADDGTLGSIFDNYYVACCRFHRHQVKVENGVRRNQWQQQEGSSAESSNLRR